MCSRGILKGIINQKLVFFFKGHN
uniref:Uncharacterized protein n=1 Tax=Anguilla anguilla TaxID=7936 RepID=A0A0E9UY86_ANGAN